MRNSGALAAAALLAALLPLHAQDRKDPGTGLYKVEIDFRDGQDGAATSGRRYTLLVNDRQKAVFKIGSRNPTVTGSFQPATAGAITKTQFTYIDVGVTIECSVRDETGGKIALHGVLDLSDIAPPGSAPAAAGHNPVIRQTKLDLDTTVELGKPTVVASINDPATTRKLAVEATVTKAE
jgi:hypothetical protein